MNLKRIIILRAVPGAGKNNFAEFIQSLYPQTVICCADNYFYDEYGNYNFDPAKLGAAHGACRRKFKEAVDNGAECVIVANTNVEKSHWGYYEEYGKENGYQVVFLVIENRHDGVNSHSVGEESLFKMENKIKSNLKLR